MEDATKFRDQSVAARNQQNSEAFRVLVGTMTCVTLLILPISITSLVLGTRKGGCDMVDPMGLNVASWLIGNGISGIASWITIVVYFACPEIGLIFILFHFLFGFAWFVVGAVILFRSNLGCIQEGATMVVFALVIWCISALQCVLSRIRKRSITLN